MVKDIYRNGIKFLLSLLIGGVIFWLVYRDTEFSAIFDRISEVKYKWIILSILMFILSNVIRAYRWTLMLNPLGNKVTTYRAFLPVMSSYFVNILFPRMGEVSRCWLLSKTDKVPVILSIGTVIAERTIDLLMLGLVALLALIFQFDIVNEYWNSIMAATSASSLNKLYILLGGLVGVFTLAVLLWVFYKGRLKQTLFYEKAKGFFNSLLEGILSVKKVKNQWTFWMSTFVIWGLYFLMTYFVFFFN